MNYSTRVAIAGLLLSTIPGLTWACASCGCALSTDAAMGYSATAGWRLNLQYDYIRQDELRYGTSTVAGVPDGNELENDTLNQYLTVGLAYNPNGAWNFELRVPYVIRSHSTYGTFDSTQPLADLSGSHSSSLGDLKLLASYQGLLPTHNLGLQVGLKLPTGHYGTAVNFDSGPNAGTPLDASLQPGTGSTDLILGAYYYQAISQDFDVIANAQFQSAMTHNQDEPGNDFRPGDSLTLSVGLRYEGNPRWVPQLQLNVLRKGADHGALADTADSAGTVVYLSPGITTKVLNRLYFYGFAQFPVHSNLQGYQLFPRWTASVGVTYAF